MSLLSVGWAGLGLSMNREHMSVAYRSGQTQGLLSSVCSAWATGGGMRPELWRQGLTSRRWQWWRWAAEPGGLPNTVRFHFQVLRIKIQGRLTAQTTPQLRNKNKNLLSYTFSVPWELEATLSWIRLRAS